MTSDPAAKWCARFAAIVLSTAGAVAGLNYAMDFYGLFRDARGKVLYVGKAKSIRKRVASHFSNPSFGAGRIGNSVPLKPVRQSTAHLSRSAYVERNSKFQSVHVREMPLARLI